MMVVSYKDADVSAATALVWQLFSMNSTKDFIVKYRKILDSSFSFEMYADKPQKPNFIISSPNPIDKVTVVIVSIVYITFFCKIYTLQPQCQWFANIGTNN